MSDQPEMIAAYPAESFLPWSGFVPVQMFRPPTILRHNDFFAKTKEFEENLKFIQPVAYTMVTDGEDNFLTYVRTKVTGEQRLKLRTSIGFGGHLCFADMESAIRKDPKYSAHPEASLPAECLTAQAMVECRTREIKEELGFETTGDQYQNLGYLYDPTNPTGLVHLGFVSQIVLPYKIEEFNPCPEVGELKWTPRGALPNIIMASEVWTRILIASMNIIPALRIAPPNIAVEEG